MSHDHVLHSHKMTYTAAQLCITVLYKCAYYYYYYYYYLFYFFLNYYYYYRTQKKTIYRDI